MELIYFFVLVYSNEYAATKSFKSKRYYLPKGIIKNYNVIINWKNFYDQPIDFDIKRYEEIRKLTPGQGEDYTTGCLLDYDYVKNNYRSIAVHLSRLKELDADPKAIQHIEIVGQLKNENGVNADGTVSIFVLTILEKNQRNEIKIFSKKCNSIMKDGKLSRIES